MQGKEPFILELAHIVDHEDGGATYSFDCGDGVQKRLAEIGLQFILYCGVAEVDIQDAYNWLLAHKIGNEDRQE
jgi:hypothetical protein